ncbi:MAG: DNA recombination protein RmuC, partial [Pseudomonadota bacterium]
MAFALENWPLLLLACLNLLLLLWLLLRKPPDNGRALLDTLADTHSRLERGLRQEITESSRSSRQELGATFATFQQALVQQGA